MAVITDPQVIAFCNNQLRPACDRLESALRTIRQLAASYSAEGLGPLVAGTVPLQQSWIADGSTNANGSKGDGRTPLLGYDVDNCIGQVNALLAWLTANPAVETVVIKASVNNAPLF